jgi:hypothetical protein
MTVQRWRLALWAVILITLTPVALFAQPLTIEAEDYTRFSDVGGTPITTVPLSGCSGGYILIGLDSAGEWTQYDVSIGSFGYYSLGFTCRGDFAEYSFRLVLTPIGPGSVQTVEFTFMGQGYG